MVYFQFNYVYCEHCSLYDSPCQYGIHILSTQILVVGNIILNNEKHHFTNQTKTNIQGQTGQINSKHYSMPVFVAQNIHSIRKMSVSLLNNQHKPGWSLL